MAKKNKFSLPNGKKINLNSTNRWASNALKSLGMSTVTMMTELMPASADLVSSNTDTIRNIVSDLRSTKSMSKRLMNAIGANDYIQIAKETLDNALEDARSGKFVNKEREDRLANAAMGLDDFDDLDMDDSDDIGAYSFEDDDGDTNIVINSNINSDNPMVKATVNNTEAIITSAQAQQKTSIAIANNQMVMDSKLLQTLTEGLTSVNENMANIITFNNENIAKFTAASMSYYEESLNTLKEIRDGMAKLTAFSQGDERDTGKSSPSSERAEEGLFTNTFSIDKYGEVIKKNFSKYLDDNVLFSTIKPMLEDKNMLRSMLASPLSFIPTMIVSKALPEMMKKSFSQLDTHIKEFFPALLMKWGSFKDSGNPLLEAFGRVFGIQLRAKENVDLSIFKRGPISFDGETKHAVTNVIPMYLRKILSALTAEEELVMDWKSGTMVGANTLKTRHTNDVRYSRFQGISNIESKLMERLDLFDFSDKKYKEDFKKDIRNFLEDLMKSDKFINLNQRVDADGFEVNPLTEIRDLGSSDKNKLLRSLIDSLSNTDKMRLFGSGRVAAKSESEKYFYELENSPNAFGLFGDASNKGTLYKSKLFNPLAGEDEYGFTATKYLRDIRKLLIKGIITFPKINHDMMNGSRRRHFNSNNDTTDPDKAHIYEMDKKSKKEKTLKQKKEERETQYDSFTDAQMEESLNSDRIKINNASDALDLMGSSQLTDRFREIDDAFDRPSEQKVYSNKGFGAILNAFQSAMLVPQKFIAKGIEKINDTLYHIIFPEDKTARPNFFVRVFNSIQDKFDQLGNFMEDKFFSPLRKFLWEGEDSLYAKFKNSEFYKEMTEKWGKAKDYLFGTLDADGNRGDDGLFSDVYKNVKSQMFQIRSYITGAPYIDPVTGLEVPRNDDAVLSHVKNMFGQFTGTVKEYLFGKEGDPDIKGTLGGAIDAVKQGFQSFGDAIFGTHKDADGNSVSNFSVDDFVKETKKHAPKALATGIMGAGLATVAGGGLLPSLFLPGGPVGGAIVGTAVGFLSQSDSFMNAVFGKKDENGERMGGFINKKTQDFFKKHKTALIGGATMGALKGLFLPQLGLGILPGLLGGPISGAVLALGTSLLTKSEGFKKLMFGDADEDGNRNGGLVGSIVGKIKGVNGEGNKLGKMAAGAIGGSTLGLIASKFGLVGATLLGGGPLIGALLGAASGIAISSDKFKKAIFGEWDEDKQIRQGGLFGKFINWSKIEIFGRMKLKLDEISINMHEWFLDSIASPFSEAIAPMKQAFKDMTESVKTMFVEGWESLKNFMGNVFEDLIGVPFGKFMEEKVMKPIRGFFNKLISGTGKIIGGIISAPFKALTFVANGIQGKHEKEAVSGVQRENTRNFLGSIVDAINPFKAKEEKRSILATGAEMFKSYWDDDTKEKIKEDNISYYKENEELKKKNREKTDAIISKRRLEHQQKVDKLEWQRQQAMGHDYETAYIDKDGNFKKVDYDIRDQEDIDREKAYEERQQNAQIVSPSSPSTNNTSEAIIDINNQSSGNNKSKEYDGSRKKDRKGKRKAKNAKKNNSNNNNAIITPPTQSDNQINNDAIIDIVNENDTGESSTTQSSIPSSNTNAIINDTSNSRSRKNKKSKNDTKSPLERIARDVKTIASQVNGQLDGVGSNTYKIRRILQMKEGIEDKDLKGSANRDRMGLGGRIRSFFYKPFESLMEKFEEPLHNLQEKMTWVGEKFKEAGKFIWELPGNLLKGMKIMIGEIWGGIKFVAKGIATIPMVMLEAAKGLLGIAAEGIKAVIPMIGGLAQGFGLVLKGVGEGIGFAAKEIIGGVGEIVGGIGKSIGSVFKGIGMIVPLIGKTLLTATSMITDGILEAAKLGVKGIVTVLGGAVELVTAPFRAIGNFFGDKFKKATGVGVQDVRVIGPVSTVVIQPVGLNDNTIERICECINAKALYKAVTGQDNGLSNARDLNNDARISDVAKSGDDGQLGSSNANAVLSAMRANDKIEDEEQAKRDREKQEREAAQQARIEATDQTAEARMTYLAEAARIDEEGEFRRNLLANTARTASATSEHKSDWGKIFSKKGIITAALLGLPLLFTNIGNKVQGWLNNAAQFAADLVVKGIKFAWDGIKKVLKDLNKTSYNEDSPERTDVDGTPIENTNRREINARFWGSVGSAAWKKGGQYVDDIGKSFIGKAVGKKLAKSTKIGQAVAETAAKNPGAGLSKNIITTLKESLPKMLEGFRKRLPDGKFASFVDKIIAFLEKQLKPEIIANHADDLERATVATNAKNATSFLGIVNLALSAYDGISGAYEVRRVFKLPHNYPVTIWMRTAAAITKMLINAQPIVAVIAALVEEVNGISFYQTLGNFIIKMGESFVGWFGISSDDSKKLQEGYAQFQKELEEYNEANGTVLSEQAYNDKINGSMFNDFIKGTKSGPVNHDDIKRNTSYSGYLNNRNNYTNRTTKSSNRSSSSGKYGGYGNGKRTGLIGAGEVPYFSQNDPRWKNHKVGEGTMGDLGCGPTAMAMAANAMGKKVNPAQLQDFANTAGFSNSEGTDARFIGASAQVMGMNPQPIGAPSPEAIETSVKRGPIVLLGRNSGTANSPYTNAGHYVVASNAGSGKVKISDPRGKTHNKTVPISALRGTMAGWGFRGAGETAGEKVSNLMMSLEGKLSYTQGGSRDDIPGGYGDCSSTVRWCYKTALGLEVGTYTGEQLEKGALVVAGNGKYCKDFFSQPGILDKLKPGDLILFGKSRTNIGSQHVEMYVGNGKMSGHGGGPYGKTKGPITKSVLNYMHSSPILEVRRYCDDAGKPINGSVVSNGTPQTTSSSSGFSAVGNFFTDLGKIVSAATSQLFGFDKLSELTSKIAQDIGINFGTSESGDIGDGNVDPTALVDGMKYSTNSNIDAIVNRNLTKWRPISAAQINTFIEEKRVKANPSRNSSSLFRNKGQAFIDAGKATGLDPRYILAHAIEESADGTSNIARTKGNYFGINAIDSNPNAAYSFGTDVSSNIMTGAKWIREHFTDKGNDSLYKMLHNNNPGPYASNPDWASNIASIMAPLEGVDERQTARRGAGDGIRTAKVSNSIHSLRRSNIPVNEYLHQGSSTMTGRGEEDYNRLLSEILQVLRSIDHNTGNSNGDVTRLINAIESSNLSGAEKVKMLRENVASNTQRGQRQYDSLSDRTTGYSIAKNIARGKLA